jgi:hypothetical protein
MLDEHKKPSLIDWLMQEVAEDDSDKDIDVVVGGELITHTAMLIGEYSAQPSKERGWLAAMTKANGKPDAPAQQRLQNVINIAKEAIRRGVLTEQQVNQKLTELRIATVNSQPPVQVESIDKVADTITSLASELAKANGLTQVEVAARPEFTAQQQQLQEAIDDYKSEAEGAGRNAEEVSDEIAQLLTEAGLKFARKQAVPFTPELPKQTPENKNSIFPSIDYEAIAKAIPLDENKPPQPDQFIQPIVTNMFSETDQATLAGRMVGSLYERLIQRIDSKPYQDNEVLQLLEVSKQTREDFLKTVEAVNKKRQEKGLAPLELGAHKPPGKDGFHFNGDTRASQDFLFYFGKSRANYKTKNEAEVRAYLTLKPAEAIKNQSHFVELAMKLYDAGIDFSAKAGSIFGVRQRTDNMVFYITASDQQKASQIIKDFLQEKSIGQGHMLAALPSPQEGLSWAMQPTPEEMEQWKKISGSSVDASYNILVAVKAMPAYLDRLVEAHRQKADFSAAQAFQQEAQRIRAILQGTT